MFGWDLELVHVDLIYHRLFTAYGLDLSVTVSSYIDLVIKRLTLKQ